MSAFFGNSSSRWSLFALACAAVNGCATPLPTPPDITAPATTSAQSEVPKPTPVKAPDLSNWELVWHDEFNGPKVDTKNWVYEGGGLGWGNAELQFYTPRPKNVHIENGNLVIEAYEEQLDLNDYTSGRLNTKGLHSFQYGRIEARIRLPEGKGLWPAFWMVGSNYTGGNWPECGEIDIMENVGNRPKQILGTVHGPGYFGGGGISRSYFIENGDASTDYHIYAVEWSKDMIQWYVDGEMYHSVTPASVPGRWVFDHPFNIILNLAVGGHLPGDPDETTKFPAKMYVDYVRVYKHK